MLNASFVAAVLEGIEGTLGELIERVEVHRVGESTQRGLEGTLGELIERVEGRDLSEPLEALQDSTAAVRHSFEDMAANRNLYVGEISTDHDADQERRSK